uniref:OTU domain-containing protein n=1 Tax=Alexandrium monilatum TaxID=311494 RepID=A0A7S4Q430_9DINO
MAAAAAAPEPPADRGWFLGVDAAVQRNREDIRYPLSVAEPLQVLAEEFQHSENHMVKVLQLGASGYAHRRRVRGDGNCFYRAVCFAWLEALVARAGRGEAVDMPLPGGWPEASLFGALAEEYRYIRSAVDRLR